MSPEPVVLDDRSAVALCCRVGVVGLGWGLFAHVPKFREAGWLVGSIHLRDSTKVQRLASDHGLVNAFSHMDDLAQRSDVAMVAVSLPSNLRKEAVLAAIRGGKHVLIQPTPIGLTVADAEEMLKTAQAAGIHHFMDLELRWVPGLRRIRELIQGNGNRSGYHVQHVSFTTVVDLGFLSRLKNPQDVTWKHDASKGGGVWTTFGPHFVDLARFLLADEVHRVRAVKQDLLDDAEKDILASAGVERPADASIFAELEMSRGVVVTLNLSGRSNGAAQKNQVVVTCSEEKTFTFDLFTSDMELTASAAESDFLESVPELEVLSPGGRHVLESIPGQGTALAQTGEPKFAEAIKARLCKNPKSSANGDLATFEDGLALQLVTEAVDASADCKGEWQNVRRARC